ncbi:GGDEF domain-containing response regulator [Alteromonas lipolytica]|uniref:Diguanylate cyclase response regulator n=1 Tax=Alteromonas lipolytica TaxID=1856405 RepID=A0A1E8FF37_9ALTE|nr:response regulator [Alteromonas lipolytica]OFI34542.1 hypothetical protein BFC17_13150 [Alteromonas lipolytica]GGF51923.1 hypothetical protein GCM10011338_00040 [Alteromonas lipolytica]
MWTDNSKESQSNNTSTILIVEDELATLTILEDTLSGDNITILPVCTEAGANRHLRRDIALFIIDLNLPDGSGLNLIKHIRKIPHHVNTPIIVTTSSDRSEDITASFMAGATDYLIKPLNTTVLFHKTKLLLNYQKHWDLLQLEAFTDPMTMLFNRRSITEKAEQAWLQSQLSGVPFCTVTVGISKLEQYNEKNGFSAGDKLIAEFANIVRQQLTNTEGFGGRLHGDNLVVVLPEYNLAETERFAQNLSQVLVSYVDSLKNSRDIGIAPKIGISEHLADSLPTPADIFCVPHNRLN